MRRLITATTVFGICTALMANAADSSTPPAAEVRQAAQTWLDGLGGKPYRATLRATDGKFPLLGKAINDHMFAFVDEEVSIGLGFSKAPAKDSTLEDLRSTFSYLALDRIPVPTVRAKNWETRLMTPVSSFKDGVILESWKDGVLRLRVTTRFFAASGRRLDVEVPADAAMPPDSYFMIRQPVQGELVVEVKLFNDAPKRENH